MVAQDRHFRRRAVDQRDARRDRGRLRHARGRYLRALRGDRAGVANECVETKDGLHVWEDHFYPEIIDPQSGEVLPEGAPGSWFHLAHQGGDAGDPLSHPRPDAAIARHRALDAPHREDHRAQRRHDDRARRQRFPDPDRGADPEGRGSRRISSSNCAAKTGSTRCR